MSDLDHILSRHGSDGKAYYAALAEMFRSCPIHDDHLRGEAVCGTSEPCDWLLKHDAVRRPAFSFAGVLADLASNEVELAQLERIAAAADSLLGQSILGDRDAVVADWFVWLSELAQSETLAQIAGAHLGRIPNGVTYDFAQITRAYVAEVACLVAGVRADFSDCQQAPIAAVVDYMDGRAESAADALCAAAGIRWLADEIASARWNSKLPAALVADTPNRTVFLVTAHESTAFLIVTACRMLSEQPDASTRDIVQMAADHDFPIQSVLREACEDMIWNGTALPKGRRLRIHIAAAFCGNGIASRSFGVGANRCPGAGLAIATAEAFVEAFRPALSTTRFLAAPGDRQSSRGARCYRNIAAITDCPPTRPR